MDAQEIAGWAFGVMAGVLMLCFVMVGIGLSYHVIAYELGPSKPSQTCDAGPQ